MVNFFNSNWTLLKLRIAFTALISSLLVPTIAFGFIANSNGGEGPGQEFNADKVMMLIYESIQNGFPDRAIDPIFRIEGAGVQPNNEGALVRSKVWAVKIEYSDSVNGSGVNFQLNKHYLNRTSISGGVLTATFTTGAGDNYKEQVVTIDTELKKILSIKVHTGADRSLYADLESSSKLQLTKSKTKKGIEAAKNAGDVFSWFLNSLMNHNNKINRGDALDHIHINGITFEHSTLVKNSSGEIVLDSNVFRLYYKLKNPLLKPVEYEIKFDRYKVNTSQNGLTGKIEMFNSFKSEVNNQPTAVIEINTLTGAISSFTGYAHDKLLPSSSMCKSFFKH